MEMMNRQSWAAFCDNFAALALTWEHIDRDAAKTARSFRRMARALRNPTPLCINGHEYHRRQRRRVKRGR